MTWAERPESRRHLAIVAYLEAHPELPWPTIHPSSVAWHVTGRPTEEAAVLAVTDNFKVMHRNGRNAFLTGYHPALGVVLLDVDRWETGMAERDWDSLGIAVAEEVGG